MLRALLLALIGLSTASTTVAQTGLLEPETFEEALEQHKRYSQMLALKLTALSWARLARSKDPRGLEILVDAYKKPRNPKQVCRHLLAQIATREFRKDSAVDTLGAWREGYDDPTDAWLWYRTLSVDALNRGPATALAIALNPKVKIPLRGAAIEALGWGKDSSGIYTAIEKISQSMPKKLSDKAILVGAMGTALERHKRDVKKREFKIACAYFIQLLDDESGLDTTAKLVVARSLGAILNTDDIVINAAPWTALLGEKDRTKTKDDELGYVRPTFFGVKANGTRICYLIDMSDSMCKDVIVPEELKSGPMSGGEEAAPKDPIPWHLVKTRFDLAREQLKLSLRSLDKDALFSVVYFGDEAELLDSSKGMSKASKGAIKKVIKELDSIKVEDATTDSPNGKLRGKTNLHGGLLAAFRVKKKGLLDENSYIDAKQFAEGCDTIFLLSDGNPSWDNFGVWDDNVGETLVGNPESDTKGKKNEGGGRSHYSGPYRSRTVLVEDLERLNLFREVEIHCIAIGPEVSMDFLQQIADLGHGTVNRLGD